MQFPLAGTVRERWALGFRLIRRVRVRGGERETPYFNRCINCGVTRAGLIRKQKQEKRERNLRFDFGMMGTSYVEEEKEGKKVRVLCLHGFRTSAEFMRTQVMGKWPDSVLGKLDLVFLDAPFPAQGKSDVEAFFPPPYYEWYQFNSETMEYKNFDEYLEYVEDFMIKEGPLDGLMGFSQGGFLSSALAGMQRKGLALTKVPKIKFVIIIGGAKLSIPALCEKAYSVPIECPSLRFLGNTDFLKQRGEMLLVAFVEPTIIRHPKGHTIPKLDERGLATMLEFMEKIKQIIPNNCPAATEEDEAHLD